MDTNSLLSSLKKMDKNKRNEMLDSLDSALSDEQKQKLVEMVKTKQLDSLLSQLVSSQEVQKKIGELLK